MKTFIFLSLLILTSCTKKEEHKFTKDEKHEKSEKTLQTPIFNKIGYNLKYNYLDSLGKKINPNKNYQYWQYATYYQGYGDREIKYTVLKEGGDISQRKKITEKIDPIKTPGIFQGGHPSYRCNYAVTIENQKVNYIKSEDEFRTFMGTIDNLEEAILLARTYGYIIGTDIRTRVYRKIENGFVLHLLKYHDFPVREEAIEITIHKDGFIKTKSLGKGRKCE